jgi:hypothetical protein
MTYTVGSEEDSRRFWNTVQKKVLLLKKVLEYGPDGPILLHLHRGKIQTYNFVYPKLLINFLFFL